MYIWVHLVEYRHELARIQLVCVIISRCNKNTGRCIGGSKFSLRYFTEKWNIPITTSQYTRLKSPFPLPNTPASNPHSHSPIHPPQIPILTPQYTRLKSPFPLPNTPASNPHSHFPINPPQIPIFTSQYSRLKSPFSPPNTAASNPHSHFPINPPQIPILTFFAKYFQSQSFWGQIHNSLHVCTRAYRHWLISLVISILVRDIQVPCDIYTISLMKEFVDIKLGTYIFSHTSVFPPCSEQLRDKSISDSFHDLQLCAVYLNLFSLTNVPWSIRYSRENAFGMVSIWDGFLTTCLRIPPSSHTTLMGFGDYWWEKSISHGKPHKMHTFLHATDNPQCEKSL